MLDKKQSTTPIISDYQFIKCQKGFEISSGILGSIVVSIPACHAGDRGSIPRRGGRVLTIFVRPVKSEGLGRKLGCHNLKKIVVFLSLCSEILPLKINISPDYFIFLISESDSV